MDSPSVATFRASMNHESGRGPPPSSAGTLLVMLTLPLMPSSVEKPPLMAVVPSGHDAETEPDCPGESFNGLCVEA